MSNISAFSGSFWQLHIRPQAVLNFENELYKSDCPSFDSANCTGTFSHFCLFIIATTHSLVVVVSSSVYINAVPSAQTVVRSETTTHDEDLEISPHVPLISSPSSHPSSSQVFCPLFGPPCFASLPTPMPMATSARTCFARCLDRCRSFRSRCPCSRSRCFRSRPSVLDRVYQLPFSLRRLVSWPLSHLWPTQPTTVLPFWVAQRPSTRP